MTGFRMVGVGSFLFAFVAALTHAQPNPQVSSPTIAYVNQALDVMQQNSVHKKTIDWVKLRRETLAHAAGAQTPTETYDAIRFALQGLGDHHSFLQLSPDLQAKDRETHARRNTPAAPSGGGEKWPPSPYIDRRTPTGELRIVAGTRVAEVVVPEISPTDDKQLHIYALTLQQAVAKLAKQKPAGWIIDLRGNLGGNMWPMLAGIGPLEGDGVLGSSLDADGNRDTWFYAPDGSGILTHDGQRQIVCWMPAQYMTFAKPQTVAVLIDRGTASSGEALAISLKGRPRTRSFGRHTHGQSTANQGFALADGANLVLTTAVEADRTGRLYPDGIEPDEELPVQTSLPEPGAVDPTTERAAEWIKGAAAR